MLEAAGGDDLEDPARLVAGVPEGVPLLARLEGQIAINSILSSLPGIKLETEDLEWNRNLTLRGLKSLPVVF